MRFSLLSFLLLTTLSAQDALTCNERSYTSIDIQDQKDPEAFNLMWAKCEIENKNIEAAMSAYERVLMINPHNTDVTIALAKLYESLYMRDDKKLLLENLENERLSPQQREIVASLTQEKNDSLHVRSSLLINTGYDSNINFLPSSNITTQERLKDSAISNIMLDVRIKHSLQESEGLSLVGGINLYQQSVYMAHEFDLLYANIEAGMGYDSENFSLNVPLVYSYAYYLERNLYNQYGVAPSISLLSSEHTIVNVGFKYLQNTYIQEADKNRDATLLNASAALYYLLGKNFAYIEGAYDTYSADDVVPLRFTQREYIYLRTGVSYALTSYLVSRLDYRYTQASFEDSIDSTSSEARVDNLHNVNLNLLVPISTAFNIQTNLAYYTNSSNYNLAAYNKSTITLGIEYNY